MLCYGMVVMGFCDRSLLVRASFFRLAQRFGRIRDAIFSLASLLRAAPFWLEQVFCDTSFLFGCQQLLFGFVITVIPTRLITCTVTKQQTHAWWWRSQQGQGRLQRGSQKILQPANERSRKQLQPIINESPSLCILSRNQQNEECNTFLLCPSPSE